MKITSYFITGANGFIGSSLSRELSRKGKKLTLLLHRSDDHPFLKEVIGTRVMGNILDPETFGEYLGKETCVIHCAGMVSFTQGDDEEVRRTNSQGTQKLLNICKKKKVKSLVFLSAGAVWGSTGSPHDLITEESPKDLATESGYAQSKIEAEAACREAARDGLDVKIVNPATVYGAGDLLLHAGGKVVKEVGERGIRLIPPGGTSWIAIEDLIHGILLTIEQGRSGQNYILSAGNIPYRELFPLIAGSCGLKGRGMVISPRLRIPLVAAARLMEKGNSLLNRGSAISPFQIEESFRYKYFNASKAREKLGFIPRVGLEKAVQKVLTFNQLHDSGENI